MSHALPDNDTIEAFSRSVSWRAIEQQKRRFNERLATLAATERDDLPLDDLADAAGVSLSLLYDDSVKGNVILANADDTPYIMGSFVSTRYRHDKTILQSIVPYNLNPAVNHTNLAETNNPRTRLRALGAELELGLYQPDGSPPSDEDMQAFTDVYRRSARSLGITPTVDREACKYQVEVHVAPGVGYHQTRRSLEGIMRSLIKASEATGLYTAISAAYPILSDFAITENRKVQTAVDVMTEMNIQFPQYLRRMEDARQRYNMAPEANVVEIFRLQGCHIHLDLAGRSEALGLFTFYTMLRSASALANTAILKGSPFVNGTCDADLLCTREYLRRTTITGRYLDVPLTPHLSDDGLQRYGDLIRVEYANSPARALLCDGSLGTDISAMHNPIGRIRPDLGSTKRICTIESTGMPVNISSARQAAVLADFEFTHVLVENYFRQHGTDLAPMMDDADLWAMLGPLSIEDFQEQQDCSDRNGSEVTVTTAAGTTMTLPEFYEMKRLYMHRTLIDFKGITPRDIDEVYMSMHRMLAPPSGRVASTPEEYIIDPNRRSTGNWGQILRDAFIEEGGTPGDHDPDTVLRVSNRVHEALLQRYL